MSEERPALRLPGYVDGIDVSRVQTIADPEAVFRAGFRFAFVKVSEGTAYRDPRGRSHLDALERAGLLCGAYGFARVSQGHPRTQARLAYDAATSDGQHVVRMTLDLESCPPGTPWTALRSFAEEWLDEVRSFGSLPVLYTMGSWVRELQAARFEVPIWVAQYRSTAYAWEPVSRGGDVAAQLAELRRVWPLGELAEAWQYSGDRGYRVAGIPEDCDRNLLRTEDVRAWFGLPPREPLESDAGVVHGSHVVEAALGGRRARDGEEG